MAHMMWRPGRRLFSTAAVLMLLTAAAHTAGQFAGSSGAAEDAVIAAMAAFHIPMGLGMTPSFLDFFGAVSLAMSITFAALGIINLTLAASADISDRLLGRIVWVNLFWTGAFGLAMLYYQVPPPLICAVVIEAILLASIVLPPRQES
jgi:hypothetical protein